MEKVGERMADISTEELERIEREYHSGSDNIKPIQEFSKPEDLYDELIASIRKYHPSTDITLIEKAYHVAFEAHKGQVRKSGEAYIIHPLCVAIILAELELDKETIAAGLLHDVLEDTVMTEEQMREEFGDEVLLLVDGVTKLQHLHLTDNIKNPKDKNADRLEMQAENLRKMFLAMAKDIRVIMIKLADRLHNMRTLKYKTPESQQRIAKETLDETFRTALTGDSKEYRESSSSLMFAFILAIVLIYLILAAQFESFKDPLIIMLTVPLAIAGALVFMYFGDITMNIFSQIGIIMLIGLVAKNGILIVEFANQKQEAGEDKMRAIKDASLQRLRPILMTSASTILGLLPLAFASGEGANQRIAMGVAVVGGMLVSTFLTMYIVPAIYSYISTNRAKKERK